MTTVNNLPVAFQNTYSRYIRLLRCVGLEFFEHSQNAIRRSYIKLLLFNIVYIPFVVSQFGLIININADNFAELACGVPMAVMGVLDILKMAIAIVRRAEIRHLFIGISQLWPKELQCEDQKATILNNWLRRMTILLNTYCISALTNTSLFEVLPLLVVCYNFYSGNEGYILPFRIPEWWKLDSIGIFLVTYLWEVICIPSILCLFLPFDLLIVILTSDISVLLRLLQVDLENSIELSNCEDTKSRSAMDDVSYKRIKTIIENHQKLLRLADKVSDIFGPVIFIHIASSSVLICFFGFLAVFYGGLADTVLNLLTVLNSTVIIFLMSLAGQMLYDTSNGIADAAYKSLWYQSDHRVKTLIKLIIIRAQRPSLLSAMGYTNLTLSSFSKIMSTAWTYFSLLIQLYSKN